MPLPPSFAKDGFIGPSEIRGCIKLKNGRFLKPIMIGTEGETDTGKTEFFLSAPGPGQAIIVDRQLGPVLDNPHPPSARRDDWGFKLITAPKYNPKEDSRKVQEKFVTYFRDIHGALEDALHNKDSLSVVIDGDSDFWEIHTLAAFGKLTGIYPAVRYGTPYAERRAITARMHDSGKIIICTNKVKDEYKTVYKDDGTPELDDSGNEKSVKTGGLVRQGFPDQKYLWNAQIRHLYRPPKLGKDGKKLTKPEWGIKILKCKANVELVGDELWGDDCNFLSLVMLMYPQTDPAQWGF